MKLGHAAQKQLAELIAGATALQGDFFRSLAFRYFHPDDVISGEGTRLKGGRFVPAPAVWWFAIVTKFWLPSAGHRRPVRKPSGAIGRVSRLLLSR